MITAAMAAKAPPGRQLNSWKEIAAHFGISGRTAQKWERDLGLPVHRLPGEKGRVLAWTGELDQWRASALVHPSRWTNLRFWRTVGLGTGTVLVLALIAAAVFGWFRFRHGPMARIALDVRTLVVTDERGREIWRWTFDEPFVPGLSPAELHVLRMVAFSDLNGDGRKELLFVYRPITEARSGNTLFCFSDRGRLLWRFRNERSISTRVERFSPPYLAVFVLTLPPARDGSRRVVFVSHHLSYYPTQAAVLSPRGELLNEYWHSGHIRYGEVARLENPTREALLLAGVSNSYKTSTLIALDTEVPWCSSDESEAPDYQLNVGARGCELARILAPRTCVSRKFDPYSRPSGLVVHPDQIHFGTLEHPGHDEAATIYRFDHSLRLLSAEVTDVFVAHHRELEAQGLLDHPFSRTEVSALRDIRILRHWQQPPADSASW